MQHVPSNKYLTLFQTTNHGFNKILSTKLYQHGASYETHMMDLRKNIYFAISTYTLILDLVVENTPLVAHTSLGSHCNKLNHADKEDNKEDAKEDTKEEEKT